MIFGSTTRKANRRIRATLAELEATTARRSTTHARAAGAHSSGELVAALPRWIRGLSPIVMYRAIAWLIAFVLVGTGLHGESSLAADWWVLALALAHVVVTWAVAPWLSRASATVNVIAISLDILFCAGLLAASNGWRGPFWLYAVSAVFWPAYRFTLRGTILSVLAFDALVVLTGFDSIQQSFQDGFGGDFVARELTVLIVAGAVAITARALRRVRDLAAESERNRIARELHDGVGKTLGGISMEAGSLAFWIERDPVEASRRARYVARISERAAIDVRDVIRSLRQRESTLPLLPRVQELVGAWQRGRPEAVEMRVSGPQVDAPVLIANEVLRMLSEMLDNVARHACATHVYVRVTMSSTGVTVSVRDDGAGFDTSRLDPWSGDGHFGLLGARERASMLGGLFTLLSAPGAGTEVTVDLPMGERAERDGLTS